MISHLLVVGAQRCGTTYLHGLLDAHPEITMARPARPEPKVFCSDDITTRGLRWYHETFFQHARSERWWGEKSTSYLEDPKAPARVGEVLGEARIIVLLRDPRHRAVSNWRFSTEHGLETRSLEDALWDNLARDRPWDPSRTSVSPFAYLERGRYADQLGPWLTSFPTTTQVIFLRDLLGSHETLTGLWRALGVDPDFRPRSRGVAVNDSLGETPTLSPGLVRAMDEYFAESNRALRDQLGRELPWWSGGD